MDEDMEHLSDYLHRYYVPREAHEDLRAQLAESDRERWATLRALIACVYDYQQDSTLYVFGRNPDAESARREVQGWLCKAGAPPRRRSPSHDRKVRLV